MNRTAYAAKVEHFATLAARAAYAAAVAICPDDRAAWEALADRYDGKVAEYTSHVRRAA